MDAKLPGPNIWCETVARRRTSNSSRLFVFKNKALSAVADQTDPQWGCISTACDQTIRAKGQHPEAQSCKVPMHVFYAERVMEFKLS